MASVEPYAVYDQPKYGGESAALVDNRYDEQGFSSGSDDGRETFKRKGSNDEGGLGFMCCICCCCFCCFCVWPLGMSIGAAITSRGFTTCDPATSGVNYSHIPPNSWLRTPYAQWNQFYIKESDVFDPSKSNVTRIGFWRTTKTWYLRDQWAYVPEVNGTSAPGAHVIARMPFFTWTKTFDIEHCYSGVTYRVAQNVFIWSFGWNTQRTQWEIYNSASQNIAVANHVKNTDFWHYVPPGWHSKIESITLPGVEVGSMTQNFESYWSSWPGSMWTVQDLRPDLLEPFALSFMAANFDIGSGSRRRGSNYGRRRYRRLGGSEKEEKDENEFDEDDLEESK